MSAGSATVGRLGFAVIDPSGGRLHSPSAKRVADSKSTDMKAKLWSGTRKWELYMHCFRSERGLLPFDCYKCGQIVRYLFISGTGFLAATNPSLCSPRQKSRA